VQYMCGPSGYLCLVDVPSVCGEYTLYDEDMSVYSEFTLYNTILRDEITKAVGPPLVE
jgi:hypothetical protein